VEQVLKYKMYKQVQFMVLLVKCSTEFMYMRHRSYTFDV